MKLSILTSVALALGVTARPNIYLIRHAEKNRDGTISDMGMERAHCLVNIFGRDSEYDIQKIIVQKPHPGNDKAAHLTQRPYNTTFPLADSLGLTMDTVCEFNDIQCAVDEARAYNGPGNILIGWEHLRLVHISEDLGGKPPKWPDNVYDWIFSQPYPYTEVTKSLQDCPGIDN